MRDVIFVSLENWDGVWRRNQFLCAEWLRRFPGMRLLFVGRHRDVSHSVRTADWRALRGQGVRKSPEFEGLTLLTPWKLLPNSLSPCRALNSRFLGAQIASAARAAGLRNPLLWLNDHCAEPLVGRLQERAVVYDITDDWSLMPSISEAERARVRSMDARLCAKANLVVVCSEALEKSRSGRCRRLVRIPNGVDVSHYRSCLGVGEMELERVSREGVPPREVSGPVFGYLGTLHGDRLDLDLVFALARAFPDGKVLLCGPDMLGNEERRSLEQYSNIQKIDPVDYSKVPGVIAGFDVCILPHRCTPFTESLNPIKLWEYLASSKPVAATPVAGFREMAHLCHLGTGSEGFVAACRAALGEDGARGMARVREAEANSWSTRAEALLEVFRQEGWLGRPVPKPRKAAVNVRGRKSEEGNFTTGDGRGEEAWGGGKVLCKTAR